MRYYYADDGDDKDKPDIIQVSSRLTDDLNKER